MNADEILTGRVDIPDDILHRLIVGLGKPLSNEEKKALRKWRKSIPNPIPIVRCHDLNSTSKDDDRDALPEHNAFEVGIRWSF